MSEQQTLATYGEDQQESSIPESDRYNNPDWLKERYIDDQMSAREIADECEVSTNTIHIWLDIYGVDTRSSSEPKRYKNSDWLKERYVAKEMSMGEIADECEVSTNTIRIWLDIHGIDTRDSSEPKRYKNLDWLREHYISKQMLISEISDECGVSDTTIGRWLKKHDIDTRGASGPRLPERAQEKLSDESWLREQYIERSRSTVEIGEELNVSARTVNNRLRDHDVEIRGTLSKRAEEKLSDESWLREQYIERSRSTVEIADEFNTTSGTVCNRLRDHDIEVRGVSESRLPEGAEERLSDEAWLQEQYVKQDKSVTSIADELNITSGTVRRWLRQHDIELRGNSKLPERAEEKLNDEEWLKKQYTEERRTTVDIADELNTTSVTVRRWLRQHNIEVRGNSESKLQESVVKKLHDEEWLREQYIEHSRSIYDIADDLNISNNTVKTWLQKYDIEIRNRIRNPDHLDHKVRSGWELNIANLLTYHDIRYEYESIEIPWGDGSTYIPDFITEEYVIEVKGVFYPDNFLVEKAEAALDTLDDREYIVIAVDRVGERIPCDIHISWDEREERIVDILKNH